jgi:hypothetical protein
MNGKRSRSPSRREPAAYRKAKPHAPADVDNMIVALPKTRAETAQVVRTPLS